MLLRTENIVKSFGPNVVLNGITLSLEEGRILALAGENGAGKSTFIKCLTGLYKPDSGVIEKSSTVSCIPQEFNLVGNLTVGENIFLGREFSRFGVIDYGKMNAEAAKLLESLHSKIDPETTVNDLGASGKQIVEIAKALSVQSKILIMDEPTTVLNAQETEILFDLMRVLRAQGHAILFVSHKLEEIRKVCDDVAILRDGNLIGCYDAKTLSARQIAEKMVGRPLTKIFPPKLIPEKEEIILRTEALSSGNAVRNVTFSLRKGAITGLAGLDGAGRTELAETIFGLRRITHGKIFLHGKEFVPGTPAHAFASGIALLTEDRQGSGILTDFSLKENITLSSLADYCTFGVISFRKELSSAEKYIRSFRIRTPGPDAALKFLSGGNQQKAAIAKGIDTDPEIYIFDEPTRGVDVGARSEIYGFIRDLAERGMACLVISSDLEEVIGLCDRVLVMRSGELAATLSGEKITEKEIMYSAAGVGEKISC